MEVTFLVFVQARQADLRASSVGRTEQRERRGVILRDGLNEILIRAYCRRVHCALLDRALPASLFQGFRSPLSASDRRTSLHQREAAALMQMRRARCPNPLSLRDNY